MGNTKYLLLFCILSVVIFSHPVLSKSYSYDYIKTNLYFDKSGSVVVSQERAYDFVGSFSYAYLDVLKKGATDVKFLGITDLDTNISLNYDINEDSTHVKATWYYSANNQVKRFLIVYKIEGAVKRYNDVSEFYWKVVEDSHESIRSFESSVNLPSPSPNLFKIFVHSSASPGKINFLKDFQEADVTMQSIPANTFVEFRVLTDPSIFSGVSQITENKYQPILNEESVNFQFSNITGSPLFYVVVIIVIPLIIFIYFYLKYGREPKVDYQLNYEQEPPRDMPPMALAAIYGGNKQNSAKGLLATIFDLARRGFIDIREEKKERLFGLIDKNEEVFKITKKGKNALSSKGRLLNFERDALKLFFKEMSNGKDEIRSSEMTKWCKWNRGTMLSSITKMGEESKNWFEKTYFKLYEPKSLKESGKFMGIMIAYFLFIFSLLFFYKILPPDFRLIILGSALVFIIISIAAHAVNKRTPEATLEIKKWKAFKRYISDFSAMKDAPLTLLHIWDRYLVYAVVLGVAKELLENIKDLSLDRHAKVAAVAWYHPIGSVGVPTGMMSPEAFSSFSSNMNSMITALSSSSSVGGGFSGGGGGGGGGGGSGAG